MGRIAAKHIFDVLAGKYEEAQLKLIKFKLQDSLEKREQASKELRREIRELRRQHTDEINFIYPHDVKSTKQAFKNDLKGDR